MRPARIIRVGSLVGFGVVALAGCLQLLGIDGKVVVDRDASSDPQAPVCGLAVPGASCRTCMDTYCCEPMKLCNAEPACAGYETCVLGCGTDYVCRSNCLAQKPVGSVPQILPLDVCDVTHCQSACGVSCGLVATNVDPDAAVSCQACVAATNGACGQAEACATSTECSAVAQCYANCVTLDCKETCAVGHDAGGALLWPLLTTLESSCAVPCGYGKAWGCVGKVAVPVAKAQQTVVTLTVATLQGGVVPGATVKACNASLKNDPTCTKPLGTTTTDSRGVATLTVRGPVPVGFGFDGYFDIAPAEGVDASAAPPIVPFLYFLSYPLSEATASFTATALAPSDLAQFRAAGGVSIGDAGAAGDLIVVAFDCQLNLASGVKLAASSLGLDLTSQIRYVAGTAPDPSAKATGPTGIAFVFGAPALQTVDVTGTPSLLGRAEGTAHAFARAGSYSIVWVVPN